MQVVFRQALERRLGTPAHEIAKKSKSNFIRSFFFLNRTQRRGLEAIYAFARVLDDAVDDWTEAEIAQDALAFWEQEFEKMLAGKGRGPLFSELEWAITAFQLETTPFYDLIRGCRTDIRKHRYQTFAELESYCYDVGASIGLMCLPIFGIRNPAAREPSIALGKALQLTNILRDVYEDYLRDRIYLPLGDFEHFHYSPKLLAEKHYNDNFYQLMAFEAERARCFFQTAHKFLQNQAAAVYLAPCLIGKIYLTLLHQLDHRRYNIFQDKIGLSITQKLGFFVHAFWETARKTGGT